MTDRKYILEVEQHFSQIGLEAIVAKTQELFNRLAKEAASLSAAEVRGRTAAISGYSGQAIERLNPKYGNQGAGYIQEYDKTFNALRRMNTAMTQMADFGKDPNQGSRSGVFAERNILGPILQPGGNITATQQASILGLIGQQTQYQNATQKARSLGVDPQAVIDAEDSVERRKRHAQISKVEAADGEYAKWTAEAAIEKRRISAQIRRVLASDDRYAQATADAAREKDNMRVREAQALRQAPNLEADARAFAEEKRTRTEQELQRLRATTPADIDRQALAAEQTRRQNIQRDLAQAQLASPDTPVGARTLRNEAAITTLRAQQEAFVQKTLAADNAYAVATAEAATSRRTTEANVKRVQNADDRYAQATAALARERDEGRAREARALRSAPNIQANARAEAEEARTRNEQRLASTKARSNAEDIRREALADVTEQRRRTRADFEKSQLRRTDTPVGAATAKQEAQTQINEARRAAYIRESVAREQAADTEYIRSKAATAEAERLKAARIRAERYGVNSEGRDAASLEAENAIRARIIAENQATQVARASASQDGNLAAQLAVAKRERIAAERAAAGQIARSQLAAGEGSFFQRIQSKASLLGPNPRGPQDFSKLGGFIGQKAITTAGYAIPGALLYGGISSIGTMVKQAEELERVLNNVEAQFESLGESDTFGQVRKDILDIAQNTGIAADEVANVFFQFKGAFGDTALALEQTDAAMKTVQVTGLSAKEVIDSLTATTKTFADSAGNAKPIEELTNVALSMQEQFGVTSNETLTFVADLAAVGKEAGASAEELAGLGAVSQQLSGRPGSALAESYSRILPAIQEARDKIISLYDAPNLAGSKPKILESFRTGDTFGVFQQLLADKASGKLTDTQTKLAISLLGSRREAQALIPAFNHATETLSAMSDASDAVDNGKLDDYFERSQDTVKVTTDRMREAFKQLGQALFEAGLSDILVSAASAAGVLAKALQGVFSVVSGLNDITGGYSNKILGIVGAIYLINRAVNAFIEARKAAAATRAVETAAEAANTIAVGVNTEAELAQGVAKERTVGFVSAKTAAMEAETVAEVENTAATATNGKLGVIGQGIGGFFKKNFGAIGGQAGASGMGRFTADSTGGFLKPQGIGAGGAAFLGIEALVLAGQVKSSYDENRGKVQDAENAMVERLKKLNSDDLKAVEEKREGFWDRVENRLFGADSPAYHASAERKRRRARTGISDVDLLANDPKALEGVLDEGLFQNEAARAAAAADTGNSAGRSRAQRITTTFNEWVEGLTLGDKEAEGLLKSFGLGTEAEYNSEAGRALYTARFTPSMFSPANLKKMVDLAKSDEAGSRYASDFLRIIGADIRNTARGREILDQALDDKTRAELVAAAGGENALISSDADTITRQYQAGMLSGRQYIAGINKQIKNLETNQQKGGGLWDDTAAEDLAKYRKQRDDYYTNQAKSMLDADKAYNEIVTGGLTGAADYMAQVKFVRTINPDTGGRALNIDEQIAQLPALYAAAQEAFQDEIDSIADPAEKLARMNKGITLDPELRRLIALSQLRGNDEYQAVYDEMVSALGQVRADSVQDEAIKVVQQTGQTVRDALNAVIQGRIDQMQLILDYAPMLDPAERSRLQEAIADLEAARVDALGTDPGLTLKTPETGEVDPKEKDQQADEATNEARDIRKAALERQKVRVRNDPVASAQIDVQIAQEELNAANALKTQEGKKLAVAQALLGLDQAKAAVTDAARDVARENAESRFDLAKAQVGNNAIEVARIEILAAQFELAGARTEAEMNNANARLIEAKRAAENALLDAFLAINETLAATAEAAGDSVKAQEIAVKNARARLQIAINQGAGVEVTEPLRADLIRAQASLRDTKFQEQLGDIDFLQQMERISVQQAIQLLRAMMQIPTNTEAMNRELMLKIKALQDELSQDFQFNLPDINLNGLLYQSRRLNDTGAAGQLYQDNRNMATVNMQININSDADVEAAVSQIQQAINPSTPSGNVFGTYVGLY